MTIQTTAYPTTKPALTLDFANSRRLDPRISFSRSSSGSYIDREGVMQYAGNDIARFDHIGATPESLGLLVEEARTNVLPYSQQLTNAYWDNNAGIVAIPNSALAPDQTYTALLVRQDTSTSEHRFANSLNVSPLSNGQLSIFVKPNGCRYVGLSQNTESYVTTVFDLNNGTVVSGPGQIVNCGNGWYRISESRGEYSYRPNFHLLNAAGSTTKSFTGDGTSGVWIWGFQKESGAFPTSYIPTPATFTSRASSATYYDANGVIQTASTNVARSAAYFPDSNGVMRPAGLLLEAAGTNLETQSTSLSTWTASNSSLTGQTITAPDGTSSTVRLLKEDASTGTHSISRFYNNTYTDWCISFYVKAAGRTKFRTTTVDSLVTTRFDLSAKTVNGVSRPDLLEQLPNGWFRVKSIGALAYRVGSPAIILEDNSGNQSYTGDNTSGIYIWGVQLEQASGVTYSTSYIATSGSTVTRSADVSSSATVTRSADVALVSGSAFSGFWNASTGSVQASFLSRVSGTRPVISLDDNTANNKIEIYTTTSSSKLTVTTAGVSQADLTAGTASGSAVNRQAVSYATNDFAAVLGGATAVTDTSGSVPIVSQLRLGADQAGNSANATIARLSYWPTKLSQATLQAVTR